MYRIVEIIRPECPWCKSGKGLIEEAPVGRRVRHVGRKINSRGIDIRVGGNVCHCGQEIIHHAWVISVIDRRSDEARLQNVTPEEAPAERHVVEMQQSCAIREYWIDIDILYVGQMRRSVLWQVQVAEMLYLAVVVVHLVHSHADLVERVAGLPLILTDNAQQPTEPVNDDERRRLATSSHVQVLSLSLPLKQANSG